MSALRYLSGCLALLCFAVAGATAELPTGEDEAEIFTRGDIEILDPWAASAIGEAHRAQVFFEFRNHATEADRLIAAHAAITTGPAIFRLATSAGGHTPPSVIKVIDLPAGGGSFELSRHGYYLELADLTVPLTMGKRFTLDLEFARAGTMSIEVTSRFHSPKLTRRIREAAARGDTAALKQLREPH